MIRNATITILFLLILLTGCSSVDSVLVLSGHVKSESGQPLGPVALDISGFKIYTDETGYFCFDGIHPDMPILFSAEHNGYKRVEEAIGYGDYELLVRLRPIESSSNSDVMINKITPQEAHSRCFDQKGRSD